MKILNWFLALGAFGLVLGCASTTSERKNIYSEPDPNKPLVDSKYSVRADRQQLDELRKDVGPTKKAENDELAFILQLTSEVKRNPSEIRTQFERVVRKKREVFDKDMTKERDTFSKKEKVDRDQFLKEQVKTRDAYNKQKHTREEVSDFFKQQNDKRVDYFANERERRGDFESDFRDKRKNFDDYIREKSAEFNQEMRAYSRKYDEMKKQDREVKAQKQKEDFKKIDTEVQPFMSTEAADFEEELEQARQRKGSTIGPGE